MIEMLNILKNTARKALHLGAGPDRLLDAIAAAIETKGRAPPIDEEEFVRIWNASASVEEAAMKTGVKNSSARSIATGLRKKGFELKYHGRRRAGNPQNRGTT